MRAYEAIIKRRSIRNFKQKKIMMKYLKEMVDAARLAPSAANIQPLEFLAINKSKLCKKIFKYLRWAGYIAPHGNPKPGCEPVSYIIILVNKGGFPKIKKGSYDLKAQYLRDVGAAAENIMLTAQSNGIASCWLGSIDRKGLCRALSIPLRFDIDTVIALGYPNMRSRTVRYRGSLRYYLDRKGVLCVPKRLLSEVMHINLI